MALGSQLDRHLPARFRPTVALTPTVDAAAVLRETRNILAQPGVWGRGIGAVSPPMPCMCLVTAVRAAARALVPDDRWWRPLDEAYEHLRAVVGERVLHPWNDQTGRTLAEVLAAIDAAIDRAETS